MRSDDRLEIGYWLSSEEHGPRNYQDCSNRSSDVDAVSSELGAPPEAADDEADSDQNKS